MSNVVPMVHEIEDGIELNLVLNTYSTNNRTRTMLSIDISLLQIKSGNYPGGGYSHVKAYRDMPPKMG